MMKLSAFRTLRAVGAATLSLAALLAAAPAQAKEKITFANLQDPIFEAIVWPITSGKVTSDLVELDISFLGIPALNQAPATRQYDLIHAAAISVPRALDRGIPLRILAVSQRYKKEGIGTSIWVKADSPIQSPAQLKGKTLGVFGLQSGGLATVRQVLEAKYGLNSALEGGDLKFAEIPAAALPAALVSGKVDAATLAHAQTFLALRNPEFRAINNGGSDVYALQGLQLPQIVITAYEDRLKEKPQAYKEAARLLRASIQYVQAHGDEVFEIIGKKHGLDPAYFAFWFKEVGEVPYAINASDADGLRKNWESARAIGAIRSVPEPESVIWADAIRD